MDAPAGELDLPPPEIEGEEELERLGEDQYRAALAAGAAFSSENWSTRTNDVMEILKKQFDSKVCCCQTHSYASNAMMYSSGIAVV